jgi:hypothetical protein
VFSGQPNTPFAPLHGTICCTGQQGNEVVTGLAMTDGKSPELPAQLHE